MRPFSAGSDHFGGKPLLRSRRRSHHAAAESDRAGGIDGCDEDPVVVDDDHAGRTLAERDCRGHDSGRVHGFADQRRLVAGRFGDARISTTISVACLAPSPCAGSAQSVAVSLLVSTVSPELTALTDLLSFTTPSANAQTTTQSLGLQNAGGGSITFTSVTCGQPFCTAGAAPASLGAGATGNINVQANPAGLSAGYYFTALTIVSSAGTITVPVTFFIAANPSLVLDPSGVQLTMPAGGVAANPDTSFLVSVSGARVADFTGGIYGRRFAGRAMAQSGDDERHRDGQHAGRGQLFHQSHRGRGADPAGLLRNDSRDLGGRDELSAGFPGGAERDGGQRPADAQPDSGGSDLHLERDHSGAPDR